MLMDNFEFTATEKFPTAKRFSLRAFLFFTYFCEYNNDGIK